MKKILIVLFVAFAFSTQLSFAEEGKKYEYMTVVAQEYLSSTYQIFISSSSSYESKEVKKEKVKLDYTSKPTYPSFEFKELLTLLEGYNKEGWSIESISNSAGSSSSSGYQVSILFFLKREKK